MLTLKQLQQRQRMLTATDVAALATPGGKAALQVYLSKVEPPPQALPEPPAAGSPADMGQRMEAVLASFYMDLCKPTAGVWSMYFSQTTYQHPSYEWAGATPDRFIIFSDAQPDPGEKKQLVVTGKASHLLECKLVGSFMGRDWDLREALIDDSDRVPPSVYVQAQWQMFVTGYRRCDVAALLYGSRFRVFELRYNEQVAQQLFGLAEEFWNRHVLPQIPPPPDGSDAYEKWLRSTLGPVVMESSLSAPDEAQQWAYRYKAASRLQRLAKQEREIAGQYLLAALGRYQKMSGPWGNAKMIEKAGRISAQRICEELGIRMSEFNYLESDPTHYLRVWTRPETDDAIDETLVEMLAEFASTPGSRT